MKTVNLKRNKIFAPLWSAKQRYIVMLGSAGSGKSVDTAQFYITRLLNDVGRNLLCVRKISQSNVNSTYNELKKAIYRLGVSDLFTFKSVPLQIDCVNGNQIIFGGMNDDGQREKLKSITASKGNITDVWIEEATEITQADFEIIDDRLRGILPDGLFYQIRLTFNPVSSSHWIKKVFFDRADKNVLTHKSTYRDNAFCDTAYYNRMERRKITDPEGYKIYGLGEWGETNGLIFSNFIIEDFNTDDENFDHIRYGQDFGFNHANALLDVGFKDGDVFVRREIYDREKTTDDIISFCNWNKNVPMYCDSAEPDRITMWQRSGFNALGVKKYPGSVSASIDWLKGRKIHIRPECVGTISEINQWRWRKDSNGDITDIPVPFGDDAMSALRYACCEFIVGEPLPFSKPKRKIYNFSFEKPIADYDKEEIVIL